MKQPYQGQCLCGAIQYEVDAFIPQMGHCHCSMCRKFHGAAFATLGSAKRSDFRWTQGEKELKNYIAKNGTIRQFCQHCGSSMTFFSPKAPEELIEISLGTLDSDLDLKPDVHIYVESKANWTIISDGLPQYKAGRNENNGA